MPMPKNAMVSRTHARQLCHKLLLQTNGTSGAEVVLDIPCSEVESWGPSVQAITAHTLLEQKSTNFQWRIVVYTSYDGVNWAVGGDLFANSTSTTASGVVQADFTDKTKLGLHIRFAAVCLPTAGTARESGVVSVTLVFDVRT